MNNIEAAGVAGGAGNDPEVRWTRSWTVRSWRSCMAVSHLRAKLLKSSGYKGPADPWAPRPLVVAFLDFVTVGGEPEHAGLHDALVARIAHHCKVPNGFASSIGI